MPSNGICASSTGSARTSRSSSAISPVLALGDEGRHGGGARHRGRDRRRGTLRAIAEAGELPWPQPERAWQSGPGPAYHGRITEARPRACARHARRGGLGGSASAGSVAGVLPASPRPPRSACRRCRDSPQNRGAHLAFTEQGRKLRVGAAGLARQEAARFGAEGGI